MRWSPQKGISAHRKETVGDSSPLLPRGDPGRATLLTRDSQLWEIDSVACKVPRGAPGTGQL